MEDNIEITFELARQNGYQGEMDLYKIRDWVWNTHDVFISIEPTKQGDILAFSYSITNSAELRAPVEIGTSKWLEYTTTINEGLQKYFSRL